MVDTLFYLAIFERPSPYCPPCVFVRALRDPQENQDVFEAVPEVLAQFLAQYGFLCIREALRVTCFCVTALIPLT